MKIGTKITTWIAVLAIVGPDMGLDVGFGASSLVRDAHAAGGEIGNARYIDYSDPLNGFEVLYPRGWSRMELGTSVSFLENTSSSPAEKASVVNFSTERFEDIRTTKDLRRSLGFFRPEENWESIVIDDRPGFQALHENQGLLYLLREPEVVTVIRFRIGASPESEEDIRVVVHSLKFQ